MTSMFVASVLALALSATAGDEWVADFDQAVKKAVEENKDLLVDFTGSDWCGWCKKLDQEVFSHEEFLASARQHFVLVALDFPETEEVKAKVPNPERNQELSGKYGVRGFPTILLLTPAGDVLGRTGYREGGPEPYVEHLDELRVGGKKALADAMALVDAFEAATGDAKLEPWNAAAEKMEELGPDGAGVDRLAVVVKAAFTLDPDNERGLKLRAVRALLEVRKVDDDVCQAARQVDPKNESGILEEVVLAECMVVNSEEAVKKACQSIDDLVAVGPVQDKDRAAMLFINAAMWNFRVLADNEKAKLYARKVKELEPDDQRVLEMMDEILGS